MPFSNDFVAMTLLLRLHCNGLRFYPSPMFINKALILLDDGLYRKISASRQGLLSQ